MTVESFKVWKVFRKVLRLMKDSRWGRSVESESRVGATYVAKKDGGKHKVLILFGLADFFII